VRSVPAQCACPACVLAVLPARRQECPVPRPVQHGQFAYLALKRVRTYRVVAQASGASSPRTASRMIARLFFPANKKRLSAMERR
jgi:hypothetical protein